MCGIVFYKSFDHSKVNKQVLRQYKRQAHRGQEGFGFYLPQTNRLAHAPQEHRIKSLLKRYGASEVLFHHRFPTSTDNVRNACHPFTTKGYFGDTEYIMVHNGWLNNQYELKTIHTDLGINYISTQSDGRFNDSEALMYDLALTFEGVQDKPKALGMASFIMIERRAGEPYRLHFGRNSYPLNMKFTDAGLSLSSEGKGQPIRRDTHYIFDYASGKLTTSPLVIPERYVQAYSPRDYSAWTPGSYADRQYDREVRHYESGRWAGGPEPEDNPSYVGLGTKTLPLNRGDTTVIDTAADLLMEDNFGYDDAKDHAARSIKQYAHKLVKAKGEAELMTSSEELADNFSDQHIFKTQLDHWTEVLLQLEDWEKAEADYEKTKALPATTQKGGLHVQPQA